MTGVQTCALPISARPARRGVLRLRGGRAPGAAAVPAGGGTLSYWYRPFTTDVITFDWQDVYITDLSNNVLATVMHVCQTAGYTNMTFNMAAFAGQTVRVQFLVHQDGFGDVTNMYVDDVSIVSPLTCTGTPLNFTITVNPTPTISRPANITVASPVGSCSIPVTYAPTVTGTPVPTVTYSFTGATTGSGSGTGSGSSFNVGVTTVTITASNICGTVSCSFTITVTDSQLPVITGPTNKTACAGDNVTFSVTVVTSPSPGGPLSYQWQSWNGSAWVNIVGATASSLTLNGVTVSMNTNSYRVLAIGLCTTVPSIHGSLYVNPLPSIVLVPSRSPILLPGQFLNIAATVSPAGGSFVWTKNGTTIAGATGNALTGLTVDDYGSYQCTYTDLNGCKMISNIIVVSAQASNNLYVYPNPNPGTFQVRFYNQANENVTVRVYAENGVEVYRHRFVATNSYNSLPINLQSGISSGTYLVEVRNAANQVIGAKWIIVFHP